MPWVFNPFTGKLDWTADAATVTGSANTVQLTDGSGALTPATGMTYASSTLALPAVNLTGNISAAAWTTSGIGLCTTARTLTDTSSSGTVAAGYTNVLGGNTIAATNATTFTDYASLHLGLPSAGTNVTITNPWSLWLAGAMQAPRARLGLPGTTTGALDLSGSTSGTVRLQTANAAGTWTATMPITAGSAGQALTTDGTGVMSWATLGTKTLGWFTPMTSQPPATGFATLDTRNSIAVLDFDAAAVEGTSWVGVIPEGANLSSGITVRIWWMATSATSGNVRWRAKWEKTGTDMDADSYDTATEATGAANGTSGIETVTSITCTAIDSLAAGDRFRLAIERVGNDATNDTMTDDAELVAVELRQVA